MMWAVGVYLWAAFVFGFASSRAAGRVSPATFVFALSWPIIPFIPYPDERP